ncbi:hypothetical protein [Leptolinea tardivitalis]|uniref:hypothetical protein n=1 Tax=Leptolinea tardivitalis TaxID=229920 RepID=UPI0007857120|nr:hypothetical protein [Leptolinea tardivitalis]GAP22869.1 hypothetical protein LTAR_03111 [Leptolinea tardivitalis]
MLSVPDEALMLVGILPDQRDLEIARLLGWYRIPLKSAPKVVDVDYLAFYQTGAFGADHRWQIEYICPVNGHELVTRAELFHDEMDHKRANEEYYKLALGPISCIDHPIKAGNWKRITFLYTIGELFNNADTVNDLVVRSDKRRLLWQSLRERAISDQSSFESEEPSMIDDMILLETLMQWIDFPKNRKNKLYDTDLSGGHHEENN